MVLITQCGVSISVEAKCTWLLDRTLTVKILIEIKPRKQGYNKLLDTMVKTQRENKQLEVVTHSKVACCCCFL